MSSSAASAKSGCRRHSPQIGHESCERSLHRAVADHRRYAGPRQYLRERLAKGPAAYNSDSRDRHAIRFHVENAPLRAVPNLQSCQSAAE